MLEKQLHPFGDRNSSIVSSSTRYRAEQEIDRGASSVLLSAEYDLSIGESTCLSISGCRTGFRCWWKRESRNHRLDWENEGAVELILARPPLVDYWSRWRGLLPAAIMRTPPAMTRNAVDGSGTAVTSVDALRFAVSFLPFKLMVRMLLK